jgi:predicted ATP-dependent endonuclease of OLD family
MLLEKLSIENYKGFGASQSIEFGQPGKIGSGLTILVGPNNGGKTTVLKTIRSLTSADEIFLAGNDDRRSQPVHVELKGKTDRDFHIIVRGRDNAAQLKKEGWSADFDQGLQFVPARRPWNDRFHAQAGRVLQKDHETGLFNNLRSQEFYVDSQFGNAIALIEVDPELKASYSKLLSELEPTITDWTIDHRDMNFISFRSVSGVSHRSGLVGEGVNNLFRLAYALHGFKAGDVLLLDEPELSLHPQAQKRLYAALRAKSDIGQIVISTHSPYFISWDDIKSGARVYRANLVVGNGTSLVTLSGETIKGIEGVTKDKKNRKLYDVVAKEVFFSNGCLFVEGQEDAHIVAAFIDENGGPPIEVFGYGSGGAPLIEKWLAVARDLGLRAAALFDADEEGTEAFKRCEATFTGESVMLRKLPTSDIRDKPDEKKVGVFDAKWNLKEENRDIWNKLLKEISDFLSKPAVASRQKKWFFRRSD